MKLLTIIQKNFKILIRSRASALVIFLGPLLLVSLLGMAFSNTEIYGLNIGVYSANYNDFSNSLLTKLTENNFKVNKYSTQDACIIDTKSGKSNICIVLPADMSLSNNEVIFNVDYSKVNIVFMILDTMSETISAKSKEIRESLTTNLLNKMVETKTSLENEKTSVDTLQKSETSGQEKTTTIKTKLGSMDVSINIDDLKITDIQSKVKTIESKAESASSSIDDLIDVINQSDLSSGEKSLIIHDLKGVSDDLDSVLNYVKGNTSDTVTKLLDDLDTKLALVQGKLAGLSETRQEIDTEVGILKSMIDDNINKMGELKNAIDAAIGNIQGIGIEQATQIVSPIKTKIQPLTTKKTHFNYLFPTLIVLIIMITAVLLASTLVMNEKRSRSFFRNFITPTKDIVFNLGIFITAILVILCQLIVFLIIAAIFFETNVISSILTTPVVLLLVIFVFVFIGMLIGYLFKSPETNVLASITVCSILLFLSSTVLPLESIPTRIREATNYSPFVLSENLLRQTMFFNFSYENIWTNLLMLLGYAVVLFGLTILAQKLLKTQIHFNIKDMMKRKKE